ncbi:MAG: inverse autotransporter beta domain-containing protein [bacterium]|nr:inverse autotransporter beta domain-containing protein [bacterium]
MRAVSVAGDGGVWARRNGNGHHPGGDQSEKDFLRHVSTSLPIIPKRVPLGTAPSANGNSAADAPSFAGKKELKTARQRGGVTQLSENGSASDIDLSDPPPIRKKPEPLFLPGMVNPLTSAMQGNTQLAAVQTAKTATELWLPRIIGHDLPEIGGGLPDWMKRIEFEWDVTEGEKSRLALWTVQPLLQSEKQTDTLFTQLQLGNISGLGGGDMTLNAGLGYRRLLAENTALAGVNIFYDVATENDHRRLGYGGELKWNAFDFRSNFYVPLSDRHSIGNGILEEALAGHDFEITSQIPYLPWARVHVAWFFWNAKESRNITGSRYTLELDAHPNLQVEFGLQDDNRTDKTFFAQFRFRFASEKIPAATRSRGFDTVAFRPRDMRDQTLHRVRRTNTIVVERLSTVLSGGGIVITRGN